MRVGKEAKFNCKEFGEDSCLSRFIAILVANFRQDFVSFN